MNEIVEELLRHLDESQRELWEERAAIIQFSGEGLTQDHSECLALLCIIRNAAREEATILSEGTNIKQKRRSP